MQDAARAVANTRLPWRELYDAHAAELAAYLTKLTGDREEAIDLMQDTFISGMRDEAGLRDVARVRAWLFRIATHLAFKRRRRARLIAFIPFTGRERASDPPFDVERDAVRTALRAISPDHAAALLLHYGHGFTRGEIADLLGRSEETIKSRIARGRRAFLRAYAEQGGPDRAGNGT
jgi:RNA polymerase sigma-70 factor (ECF subfamily)